jgi:hypothetical protein
MAKTHSGQLLQEINRTTAPDLGQEGLRGVQRQTGQGNERQNEGEALLQRGARDRAAEDLCSAVRPIHG